MPFFPFSHSQNLFATQEDCDVECGGWSVVLQQQQQQQLFGGGGGFNLRHKRQIRQQQENDFSYLPTELFKEDETPAVQNEYLPLRKLCFMQYSLVDNPQSACQESLVENAWLVK